MTTYTATASVKGQMVIPVELRRKYGIDAGTRIRILDTGHEILLQPLNEAYYRELRGSLPGKKALKALLEMHDAERDL